MNNKTLKRIILEEIKYVIKQDKIFEGLAGLATTSVPGGDILAAWKLFPKAPTNLKTTVDLAKIYVGIYSAFKQGGLADEFVSVVARNIVYALVKSIKQAFEAGITSVKGTADIIKNVTDAIQGIFKLCTKFNVDPGKYFSKYLQATAEGTTAGALLTLLSVALGTYTVTDFLINTGKELRKSKGVLKGYQVLKQIEDKIKEEGFQSVQQEYSSNAKQNELWIALSNAIEFNPYAKVHFPDVIKLFNPSWKKSLDNVGAS